MRAKARWILHATICMVLAFVAGSAAPGLPRPWQVIGEVRADIGPTGIPTFPRPDMRPLPAYPDDPIKPSAALGYMAGEGGVNDGGRATYQIPLQIPPGINGMQPALSLNYVSSGPNGQLGLGWSLSAVSRIERCNKTLRSDGVTDGVEFSDSDALCLEGRKLVQVPAPAGQPPEYRTRVNPFERIVHDLVTDEFRVFERDGRIATYRPYGAWALETIDPNALGNPEIDSLLEEPWRVRAQYTDQVVPMWTLDHVEDRAGNTIRYHYETTFVDPDDHAPDESWLSEITYTHRGQSGGNRRIEFDYQDRPDHEFHYADGVRYEQNRRLYRIRMYAPPQPAQMPVLQWEYRLGYGISPKSGRSILERIEHCDAFDRCLWAREFNWQKPASGQLGIVASARALTPVVQVGKCTRLPAERPILLDADGDGRTDLLHLDTSDRGPDCDPVEPFYQWMLYTSSDGFRPHIITNGGKWHGAWLVPNRLRVVDLDADGRDELFLGLNRPDPDLGAHGARFEYACFRYDELADDFVACMQTEQKDQSNSGSGSPDWYLAESVRWPLANFIDADGDGRPDWVEGSTIRRNLGKANNGFVQFQASQRPHDLIDMDDAPKGEISWLWNLFNFGAEAIDRDGDGRAELLMTFNDKGFSESVTMAGETIYETQLPRIDPQVRAVSLKPDGSQAETDVAGIAKGVIPYAQRVVLHHQARQSIYYFTSSTNVFADINGDGLKDQLIFNNSPDSQSAGTPLGSFIQWNTGRGFTAAEPTQPEIWPLELTQREDQFGQYLGVREAYLPSAVSVVDVNHDGRDDLLVKSVLAYQPGGPPHLPKHTRLYVSNGHGFDTIEQPFDPGEFWEDEGYVSTQPANFDGNGDVQFLRMVADRFEKVNLATGPEEVIASVQDEGADHLREIWTYAHPHFARAPKGCDYPLFCPTELGLLVAEHWVSQGRDADGLVNYRRRRYEFSHPRSDLRGQGFLGFESSEITDLDNASLTVRHYGIPEEMGGVYPFAGAPRSVTTYTPIMDEPDAGAPAFSPGPVQVRVDELDSDWSQRSLYGGKSYFPYVARARQRRWQRKFSLAVVDGVPRLGNPVDPQNDIQELDVSRAYGYDDYGNLVSQMSQTQNGESRSAETVYENRDCHTGEAGCPQGWLIGLALQHSESSRGQTRTMRYQYDQHGLPYRIDVEPNGADDLRSTTWLIRDDADALVQVATQAPGALDHVENLYYDADRVLVVQRRNALGHAQTVLSHPALGVPLLVQDANGVVGTSSYDGFGRVLSVDTPTLLDRTWTYGKHTDAAGILVGMSVHGKSADGAWQEGRYDELGRPMTTIRNGFRGEALHTQVDWNLFGHAVRRSLPGAGAPAADGWHATFDTLGRPRVAQAPDGTQTVYVNQPFLSSVTDASGRERRLRFDADGRVERSEEVLEQPPGLPKTLTTRYLYGAFDTLTTTRDPAGNEISIAYDQLGRKTSITDPDAGTRQFQYDGFGQVRREITPNGAVLHSSYDALGRPSSQTDSQGTTSFAWDSAASGIGALAVAYSPDGVTREESYDALGRPSRTRWTLATPGGASPEIFDFDRSYDDYGRPLELAYPIDVPGQRFVARFGYNAEGFALDVQRSMLGSAGSAVQPVWTALDRDSRMNLVESQFGNGIVSLRDYEPLTGLLSSLRSGPPKTPSSFEVEYAYDERGNISERKWPIQGIKEQFGYDTLDRLVRWNADGLDDGGKRDYRYDDRGNLTSIWLTNAQHPNGSVEYQATYGVNGHPNQLASSSLLQSTGYDLAGNQIVAGTRQVTYTDFDSPRKVTRDGRVTRLRYDAMGNRVEKCIPPLVVSECDRNSDGTVYLDGLYERRRKNGILEHKFMIPGGTGIVAQVTRTPVGNGSNAVVVEDIRYLEHDHLGSANVSFNAGGSAEVQVFDPWGKIVAHTGGNALGQGISRGFTDHEMEPDFEWVNMRGRMYDPGQRRMISSDPYVPDALFSQGRNPYSYVLNNPLRFADPTGFLPDGSATYSDCIGCAPLAVEPIEPIYVGTEDSACIGPCRVEAPIRIGVTEVEHLDPRSWGVSEEELQAAVADENLAMYRRLQDDKYIGAPGRLDAENSLGAPGRVIVRIMDGLFGPNRIPPGNAGNLSSDNIGEVGRDTIFVLSGLRALTKVPGGPQGMQGAGVAQGNRKIYTIAEGANPEYEFDASLGQANNCADCSVAGMRRITGADPGAVAQPPTSGGSRIPRTPDQAVAHLERGTGWKFGLLEDVSADDVVRIMKGKGPGSVATVGSRVESSGSFISHAVVAWNDNGVIRFVDFQNGRAFAFPSRSTQQALGESGLTYHIDLFLPLGK